MRRSRRQRRPSGLRLSDPEQPPPAAGGLTLGTAGHVDHGKTALVGALSGTDTDGLDEEKRRGISIELGFAECDLGDGRSLGIVDVPGHERLVRTMVAGAAGIDLFLVVVAADDGVMPQTREHLLALEALGIGGGVIALTKIDAVAAEVRDLAAIEAAELAEGIEVVEVSARTGEGVEALRAALARSAAAIERDRAKAGWPVEPGLMHVDRSFSIPGAGTVATGTTATGRFEAGERVRLLPSGEVTRIRGLQSHGREVTEIGSGRRAAINLAGVDRDRIDRGDVIVAAARPAGWAEPSYRLDGLLVGALAGDDLAGERVQVHHGTRDVPARLVDLGDGLVQLRLEAPVIARARDRVVLRRIAPPATLGGLEVVDPDPRRHGPGPEAEHLLALTDGEPEEILAGVLAASTSRPAADPDRWIGEPRLAYALARFDRDRWLAAVAALAGSGAARIERELIVAAIPEATGRRAEEGRRSEPSPGAERLARLLADDGLEPRAPAAIAEAIGVERAEALSLLGELVAAGRAVRVKEDVFYEASRLGQIERLVSELVRRRGSISLAELRDALRTSRKYSQAILEHLDGRGVLVRQGERHLPRALDSPDRTD